MKYDSCPSFIINNTGSYLVSESGPLLGRRLTLPFLPALRTQILWIASLLRIMRQLGNWLPVWRLTTEGRFQRLHNTFWLVVGPMLIYDLFGDPLESGEGQ